MNKACISIFLILMLGNLKSQTLDSCSYQYNLMSRMESKTYSNLGKTNIPIMARIEESRKYMKINLNYAYKVIREKECIEYPKIANKIIEWEMRLGNNNKALEFALGRLDKLNPDWKQKNNSVDPSHLSILAEISRKNKSNDFYTIVESSNGRYGRCETSSYSNEVSILLNQAEILYADFGKIYCQKFLENSPIIINEANAVVMKDWDKIFDLMINSLSDEYSFDEMKSEYESSVVKENLSEEENFDLPEYYFNKSKYYFKFYGFRVFFKTMICPGAKSQYKRCQPAVNRHSKLNSKLYDKIVLYAS